jgi:hypothetical protein
MGVCAEADVPQAPAQIAAIAARATVEIVLKIGSSSFERCWRWLRA